MAPTDVPRVVVDTSVWVAAAINPDGPPGQVLLALRQRRFLLVTSEPLLQELADVLARPRLARRYRLGPEDIATLDRTLRHRAELVAISGDPQGCRDPKDDMIIETALAGGATIHVSRDEDLTRDLTLAAALERHDIAVLTIRRFLALLGTG